MCRKRLMQHKVHSGFEHCANFPRGGSQEHCNATDSVSTPMQTRHKEYKPCRFVTFCIKFGDAVCRAGMCFLLACHSL